MAARTDVTPAALGPRLRARRERAGLTLRALAGRLGMSHVHVLHMEQGKSEPSIGMLVRLADEFGVSCDWLLGRTRQGE